MKAVSLREYGCYGMWEHPAAESVKWAAALSVVPESPAFRQVWHSLPDWLHKAAAELSITKHTVLHLHTKC